MINHKTTLTPTGSEFPIDRIGEGALLGRLSDFYQTACKNLQSATFLPSLCELREVAFNVPPISAVQDSVEQFLAEAFSACY